MKLGGHCDRSTHNDLNDFYWLYRIHLQNYAYRIGRIPYLCIALIERQKGFLKIFIRISYASKNIQILIKIVKKNPFGGQLGSCINKEFDQLCMHNSAG